MHEALELRREHQEHHEQRDADVKYSAPRRFFVFQRVAG